MRITVLAGGVGAARFLRGLKAAAPDAEITVIGNTGDDITLFGLRVCPDLDTVMYTLGGGINEEPGLGPGRRDLQRAGPSWPRYGVGPDWFTLGDRDFATHIVRSQLLDRRLPAVRRRPRRCATAGSRAVRLLPMSDDPIETHVVDRRRRRARACVHFQEWWVRLHARGARARRSTAVGAAEAKPAPGVLEAIGDGRRGAVPAVEPGGQHRHDPGRARHPGGAVDGHGPVVGRVADHRRRARSAAWPTGAWPRSAWRPRPPRSPRTTAPDLLDGWLVDDQDEDAADRIPRWPASRCRAVPLLHARTWPATAAMARPPLDLAAELAA